jgi:hypothetical protein
MRIMFLGLLTLVASGCTVSIIQTDTRCNGSATDLVDSTPTTSTDAKADVQIPLKGL